MDASLAVGVPTSAAAAPSFGADLLGWTALPLLAHAPEAGPWLFVTGRAEAWLSRGALVDADFVSMPADYTAAWPFANGALAGVVLDGDALGRSADAASIDRILGEARRVTGGSDAVLVVCGDRLVPRRLREWREYGRQRAAAWRRGAARCGQTAGAAAFACLDGERLTDLTLAADSGTDADAARGADRVVLRIAAGEETEPGIRTMVTEASRATGIDLRIDRIAVRKIGKTAVFLTGGDRRRYILRVARSPIARARAQRNFDTLESLGRPSLDHALRCRVPAAVYRATQAGYPYFIETCLDGTAGPLPGGAHLNANGWATESVAFISALHDATRQRVRMDDGPLARLVLDPIARLKRACRDNAAALRVLDRMAAHCSSALGSRELPLVQTHGDFTESNCLFDADGRLTAVVDWEVSERAGLPLLDLLQLMPIKDETSQHPRWQRFDAWLDLWRAPERLMADPVFGPYIRTVELEPAVVRALILSQWVTHIADRIQARGEDERWMRVRVWQPLESLERTMFD